MLEQLLVSKIRYQIEKEKSTQIGSLSGSNALLFDEYNFEAESSDHCPRIALLRRVGDICEDRDIGSFISNSHGRTFEEFLRKILEIKNDVDCIEFKEEEEAEVILEDANGTVILTARPDKLMKINNDIFPIEIKTIQSANSAYTVFIKEKPKLGALIQIAIYMYGHKLKKGFILYCASNWFSGFAGRGNMWRVKPSFKVFEIELKEDNLFYYNGNKSIVTMEKILAGSYKFLEHKRDMSLPARPLWFDVTGEMSKYDGCSYCFAKDVCNLVDSTQNFNLNDFFDKIKESKNAI